MKRFKTYVSVLLAIGLIGCVLLGKVPHAHAATAQNGVMLIFNNNLGSSVSGNFWLNDTGKQMVFTETEDGDKRMSLTFTNYGENTVEVQLRVVSSDWQQTRGSVKIAVPAGESANAELMNLNVQENDVYYFYLTGLTQTTKLSFKANYAAVDYTALTAASMQGTGASTFTAEVLYAELYTISLEAAEHVQYTVSLNNSLFSTCRNQKDFTFAVPAGDTVQVIASPEAGYYVDCFISGEKTVTRLSRYTFTAAEDTTVKALAIKTDETVANGVYLEFNQKLEVSDGNFWLDDAGITMFYGNEGAKKANITFVNYDTKDITAMFRVVSASWQEVRFVESVTVPAGGIATIEAEDVALGAGDIVYLYLKDLTATSKLGFFASGTEVDYSMLTAASMQGTGENTFTLKLDAARAVTISGAAVEGAVYNVTFHGMKTPQINNIASFEQVVAAGTLVKVEAVGENAEGLVVGSAKVDKIYQFRAESDVRLYAQVSDSIKVQNGLTLTFNDALTADSGNFWFKQAENLTFTEEGDTRLSVTVYNEGENQIAAIFRVVNSQWEPIAQNAKVMIPAGESRTIEFMNMAVHETGDIYYMYLEGLTAQTKLRMVFNHADVDYSAFTAAEMEGTGEDTFTASTEKVEAVILTLEKNSSVTYTVSVNDSVFASFTKAEALETALIPGTAVEIIAYAPDGMVIKGWEKDGTAVSGEKMLRFIAEGTTKLKAIAEETAAEPSNDGDTATLLPVAILLFSAVSLVYVVQKRKKHA